MANMEFYQEFERAFNMLRKGGSVPDIQSFPKTFREADDPEHWEKYADKIMVDIAVNLYPTKIFEIDNRTKRAMLQTAVPSNKDILRTIRLPFKSIFLDIDITSEDDDLNPGERIGGVLIHEIEIKRGDFMFMVYYTFYKQTQVAMNHFKISFTDARTIIEHASGLSYIAKILEKLIVNTVLFISDPEVEVVEFHRSEKNQVRRHKEGKAVLPSSNRIVLTGRIKQYFENHGHHYDGGKGYSHKFDVMSHWRCFRSDRYVRLQTMTEAEKEKLGYKERNGFISRWIPSFVKGTGIHVKKNYELKVPKDEDEIDLDSIKPLPRPLASMRKR